MRARWIVLGLLSLLAAPPALAVRPDEVLPNPALEARARTLSADLRCMVCQNQNIDDSDADLARDIRILVRERLTQGDSDAQVIDYLVARYGQFVLLRPRFEGETLLLWIATPTVLIFGLGAAWVGWRRGKRPADAPLNLEEEARLAELISGEWPK